MTPDSISTPEPVLAQAVSIIERLQEHNQWLFEQFEVLARVTNAAVTRLTELGDDEGLKRINALVTEHWVEDGQKPE